MVSKELNKNKKFNKLLKILIKLFINIIFKFRKWRPDLTSSRGRRNISDRLVNHPHGLNQFRVGKKYDKSL